MATTGDLLGAGPPTGSITVTVYVPSVDRRSRPINQKYWVEETLICLGRCFGGATAHAPGEGVWRDDDKDGELIRDHTRLVFAICATSDLLDPETMDSLGSFMRRMGRETNQGEVMLEIEGEKYSFREFDRDGECDV